jgi:hypothetical protein
VAGKEKEALAFARTLYQQEQNRTPTLLILLFVLENFEHPERDGTARAIELFGTPEKALEALAGHWHRTREKFPVFGVAATMEALEKMLNVPAEKSIFNQPMPPQWDTEDSFTK